MVMVTTNYPGLSNSFGMWRSLGQFGAGNDDFTMCALVKETALKGSTSKAERDLSELDSFNSLLISYM